MECVLCKIQYVGKIETSFNIRLNNHRSDVSDPNVILACRHLTKAKHSFNRQSKFTLIEAITNVNKPKEILQEILKRRENFWIKTLGTLHPRGLNQELNPE